MKEIELINVATQSDLQKILFVNDTIGYIVGGIRYSEASIFETYNGGKTWNSFEFTNPDANKKIYGITRFQDQVFAVGLDGKIFKSHINQPVSWQYIQTNEWEVFHGINFASNNTGFITYGVAFYKGGILKTDSNGVITQKDTFGLELSDVQFISPLVGYASGYGAILKTVNEGQSWAFLNIQGDFFKALSCPDENNVWSVGYNGSIVHSKDAGASWEKQRNGNNPLLERWRLNDVLFINATTGYSVGDGGLLIKTTDGGKNWQKINTDSKEDLQGMAIHQQHLWLVGSKGTVIKIKE